jgi:hypothetical protein
MEVNRGQARTDASGLPLEHETEACVRVRGHLRCPGAGTNCGEAFFRSDSTSAAT